MLDQGLINKYRNKEIPAQKLFIDGNWVNGSGADFDIISPIDRKPFTSIARATVGDMNKAIKSARDAFEKGSWSNMPPAQR